MNIEDIAKAAHQINKAYCCAIGDDSQPDWDCAPDWQKNSAIAGVVAHMNSPDISPADCHELWLKHKREDGWRHGPVKDENEKTHPFMRPYDQLPKEQQVKDYLFSAVVKELASYIP